MQFSLPPKTRITGPQRTQLANHLTQLYENGNSIRDLCHQTGRSYGFIHRILTAHGTQLRTRGRRHQ